MIEKFIIILLSNDFAELINTNKDMIPNDKLVAIFDIPPTCAWKYKVKTKIFIINKSIFILEKLFVKKYVIDFNKKYKLEKKIKVNKIHWGSFMKFFIG